jgi:hypothetical protein
VKCLGKGVEQKMLLRKSLLLRVTGKQNNDDAFFGAFKLILRTFIF